MKQLLIITALFFSIGATAQIRFTVKAIPGNYKDTVWSNAKYPSIQRMLDSMAAINSRIGTGGAPVTSVFTRTGAITAQSGDYAAFYPTIQRLIDSMAAVSGRLTSGLALKLNITDTANLRPRLYAGSNITITGTYPNLTINSTASGAVTSVGMTVPTGLQVANSPITSSGTLAVTFQSGYSIPTTAKQTEWDAAYLRSTQSSYLLNPVPVTNYDSLLWRKNDSTAIFKLVRFFAGSNKLAVNKTINDSSNAYSFDVNEANLNIANQTGSIPLSRISQSSATTGQVAKWNGSAWAAATDETGGGGVSDGDKGDITISGSGTTYTIDNNAVTTAKINDGAVTSAKMEGTISGKRWVPRVGSTTSSATPTINTDNVDIYKLTAQAANITSFTTNLTGTPNDGDILEIQITGTAARTISWGASFVASTVALPTTTVSTNTLTVIFQYYTTSSYGNNKWVCVNSY